MSLIQNIDMWNIYVTYVHLLLVYYSVFNACYISIMGHA